MRSVLGRENKIISADERRTDHDYWVIFLVLAYSRVVPGTMLEVSRKHTVCTHVDGSKMSINTLFTR